MDAGTLGDLKNATWLAEHGRRFIISCASNCPAPLWAYMKNNLQLHQWKSISNNQIGALSYFATKGKGGGKIVNLLFNTHTRSHNILTNHPRSHYVKKTQTYEQIPTPEIIFDYNNTHIFIDALKNKVSRSKNIMRARKAWRSRLNNSMELLRSNCCEYFRTATNQPTMTLVQFTIKIIKQLHSKKRATPLSAL